MGKQELQGRQGYHTAHCCPCTGLQHQSSESCDEGLTIFWTVQLLCLE